MPKVEPIRLVMIPLPCLLRRGAWWLEVVTCAGSWAGPVSNN